MKWTINLTYLEKKLDKYEERTGNKDYIIILGVGIHAILKHEMKSLSGKEIEVVTAIRDHDVFLDNLPITDGSDMYRVLLVPTANIYKFNIEG